MRVKRLFGDDLSSVILLWLLVFATSGPSLPEIIKISIEHCLQITTETWDQNFKILHLINHHGQQSLPEIITMALGQNCWRLAFNYCNHKPQSNLNFSMCSVVLEDSHYQKSQTRPGKTCVTCFSKGTISPSSRQIEMLLQSFTCLFRVATLWLRLNSLCFPCALVIFPVFFYW